MRAQRIIGMVVVMAAALPASATITATNLTAPSITFTSTNPDSPATASTTISWSAAGGTNPWNLKVAALATTLSGAGCSTAIPVSAVTATSAILSVTPSNKGGTGTFSGLTLSTTPTQIMGGTENNGNNNSYSVTITYTLQDSWKYIATASASCTVNLTYTLTLQ